MSDEDDELIAELWREVRPNQLELVAQLVDDLTLARVDVSDHAAWRRVRTTSHRLAGTLGSFGQQPAGDLAVRLDRTVNAVEVPGDDDLVRAAELAGALRDEMVRAAEADTTD